MSRAWIARFAELSCVYCKRKKVIAGPGSFCQRCYAHELRRLQKWYGRSSAGRDTTEELSSITRKYDAAQIVLPENSMQPIAEVLS